MADRLEWMCHACGNTGLDDGDDGFFYCTRCGSRAEDIIDAAVADEDIMDGGDGHGALYLASHSRRRLPKPEPISLSQPQSQLWGSLNAMEDDITDGVKKEEDAGDGVGPIGPSDFGSTSRPVTYDDYYSEVSQLICGLAGTIWLRFLAFTRIFADGWADEVFRDSESQKDGMLDDFVPQPRYKAEPHNIHGQRAVMVWYKSLSKKIPLSYSLVISYLACHIMREAVLPTDILKWSLEGRLPYFDAFVQIEKQIGPPSKACPIRSIVMFRPSQAIPLQKLESQAASIAQIIGLELPPVNFYLIASRYLKQLSLPVDKILPQACRIFEWSMPPELWLSANEFRLPTRVCVMSILIVAIRILYNINGFGKWEMSLSSSSGLSSLADQKEKMNTTCNSDVKLLHNLETRYDRLGDTHDFSKDMPLYLQYCKDTVFASLESSLEDHEEERIISELWVFYQNQKDSEPLGDRGSGLHNKRSRDDVRRTGKENKKSRDDGCTSSSSTDGETFRSGDSLRHSMNCDDPSTKVQDTLPSGQPATASYKDRAIRQMKLNMEENKFCYIPHRVYVRVSDYLHYARKREEGALTYAAHADYYILLRSCAKVAQVDIRVLHLGVLSFERRLAWLENRIDHCLHLKPPNGFCEFCRDEVQQNATDDSIGLSNLNL
ncbi:hypothetical protein F0562_033776 [Nyssa sinensis]|uniref:Rrn7/TAF1B C-terminal cyclin domain-containing protein n=1 Tax=Nyssa sinensis TaxID=561372 RepID=A0A5J5AEG2_9ASTE|nr:hypothetical protein F0562_033776 [Nyssa sinensis]